MALCGEGKGWDRERNHRSEAVPQTSGFSDEVDEGDREMETPCGFSGPRETHCHVSVKVSFYRTKKAGIQSIGKKINHS